MFPVDPNAPLEKKPYMQRPGGSADGNDLKQKGLKGIGFGAEQPKNVADLKYEKEKNQSFKLPWTQDSLKTVVSKPKDAAAKASQAAPAEAPKKGGFFGLF